MLLKLKYRQTNRQAGRAGLCMASGLLFALLVISGTLFSCFAETVEETMQPSILINANLLGDTRNSASVPHAAALKGKILWKAETALKTNPQPARHLAIKDDFLVVSYGADIAMHLRASGKPLWSWQIGSNFKFQLTPNGLVTLDQAGYYRILGFDKSLGEPLSLPFLGNRTFLYYIQAHEPEFRYCYTLLPSPTNSPGDMVTPPQFTYMRFDIEEDDFIWQYDQPAEVIDVLADQSGGRIIVVCRDAVFSFPPDSRDEKAVTRKPFEAVLAGSISETGKRLLVAKQKPGDTFHLMALDADLKPSWQYDMGSAVNLLQPPVPMQDESVCLLQGKDLVNVAAGKRNWSVSIPGFSGEAYLTALKDGDVLVAAGPALTQFSGKGEKRNTVFMEEPITCRPIVDDGGHIFVAGSKGIYKLK